MKKIALLIIIVSFLSESFGQEVWTKYGNNPILQPGVSGSWDDSAIFVPSVLFDGSSYRMWYGGNDGMNFRIGHAISSNGIIWIKDTLNNPVLDLGNPGEWDDNFVYTPKVVFNGTIYHMWYTGNDGLNNERIGHATSPDGINWTKDPLNPVVTTGQSGSWDDQIVAGGHVFLQGSIFHMWYAGFNGSVWGIGHATSTDDGSSWTKDPSNPVLTVGLSNEWDFPMLQPGSVIYEPVNSVYYLFYGGGEFMAWEIGYATSPDISGPWTKNITNPILSQTPSGWDGLFVGTPNVIYDQITSNYKMWYTGGNAQFIGSIGLATAPVVLPDTIHVPADYPTIQAGINSANNGDLVLVEDGTYLENINYRGKAITVASNFIIDLDTNHISNTIIDGSQPSNPDTGSVVTFNSGEDTTSMLCGFTITGGSGNLITESNSRRGGGVLCYLSSAKIEYNTIENNECIYQHGLGGGISGSNVSSDPHLMYVIIENNKIRNNRCESTEQHVSSGGVHLRGEGRIIKNQIINNEAERTGVPGNNQNSFGAGIICGWNEASFAYVKIYDNFIADNRALSNNGYANGGGVDIQFTICDFRGNTVKENKVSGTPHANGGGMRVLYSSLPVSITENNFINNGPLNITDIVIGGGLFTVQNDSLTVENNVFQFNSGLYGGGIYISEDSVISVRNNKFLQNSAADGGGGIFISQSSPLFENNLVAGNTAFGGGGFGIYGTGSNSYEKTVMASQMIMTGGLGEITDEKIFQSPLKKNTTLVVEPLFINNTIVDNSATSQGGGIYIENTQATIINTILWGNTAALDSQLYSINGTFLLEYSNIQGWDTTNNTIIDVDPFFVDPINNDFHLQDVSHCIGAAIDSIDMNGIMCYCPPFDIEGNQRPNPFGSMPDIGAYESELDSPVYVEKYESLMPVEYALRQNYPNPFNPTTTIEFTLPKPGFVTLSIFNILGEKVAIPVSEYLAAGSYKYHWNARNLASGIYVYRLKANELVFDKKMILLH